MLDKVKLALRLTTNTFDAEITELIEAARIDLSIAGIINITEDDPIISRAIILYCKLYFGNAYELGGERAGTYVNLKKAYDEQKAQLSMRTGYTNWGDAE